MACPTDRLQLAGPFGLRDDQASSAPISMLSPGRGYSPEVSLGPAPGPVYVERALANDFFRRVPFWEEIRPIDFVYPE